jgi:hypothetical protein
MAMHRKKSLSLKRETIRQLAPDALPSAQGGIEATSITCGPAPTQRNSCFNSCYKTDCCLMRP